MDVYCLLNDFSNLIQSNSSLFPITVFIDVQCPHLSDVWRIQERCQCEGFVLFLLSIYHLLVNIFSFANTIHVNVVLIKMTFVKMTNIVLKGRDDAGGDGGSVLARLMLLVRRFQFEAFSISNSRE